MAKQAKCKSITGTESVAGRAPQKPSPDPETVAWVHVDMLKERKGRPLSSFLAAARRERFFTPHEINETCGVYFLDFTEPAGHVAARIAITKEEVGEARAAIDQRRRWTASHCQKEALT